MSILVFKTSVNNKQHVHRVQTILDTVQCIKEWNFDLDDCDNILRVVANDLSARTVEDLLNNAGIFCKELDD